MINEKLEKLNQEIAKGEARLRRAQHEEKILEHQVKQLTRKERTHRLCTRGAMLESFLLRPEVLTDEDVMDILKQAFSQSGMKEIVSHIANFEAHKPVHVEYAAIRFKKPREQFAAAHRDELDAYNAAIRYFKVHLKEKKYSIKKLNEEQTQLAGEVAGYKERLSALQEDVKILRDVRHWLNQVLPSEQYRQTAEPGKKPSIQQAVKGRTQRIREEQAEKRKQPRTEKKQDMEL